MRCWSRSWRSGSSARFARTSPSACCARRGLDDQVAAAVAAIKPPDGATLARDIERMFKQEPDAEWRDHIEAVVRKQTGAS